MKSKMDKIIAEKLKDTKPNVGGENPAFIRLPVVPFKKQSKE